MDSSLEEGVVGHGYDQEREAERARQRRQREREIELAHQRRIREIMVGGADIQDLYSEAIDWQAVFQRHEAERVQQQRRPHETEWAQLRARHEAELAELAEAQWAQQRRRQEILRASAYYEQNLTLRMDALVQQHIAQWAQQHENDAFDMGELIRQCEVMTMSGLSEEVISRCLKTRKTIRVAVDDEGDPKICTVCHDNLHHDDDDKKMIAVLDCGHEYHSCCLKLWLQRKNICPLCERIAIKL